MTVADAPQSSRQMNWAPPGPVTMEFLQSPSFVRGLMGPLGSGKSTTCVIEILRRATLQEKGPDGKRRTRWAVIRNSYPELKTTTIKTWSEWIPLEYGRTNFDSPIIHHIKTADLDMEVLFMALDRPDDAKKLLSLELTGAWINECREIPKAIIDALTGRVGRYPSKAMGGPTWSGIIMDTNPPDDQSWWYKLAEEERPKNWSFFRQPGGLTAEAENVPNLPNNYYQNIVEAKDPDWVKVYVDAQYGFLNEGRSVYPMFRDSTHVPPEAIKPIEAIALQIGCDWGLTPAAIIGQKLPSGQWLIIDEMTTENCGPTRFAELLVGYMKDNYRDFDVAYCYGDPSGETKIDDKNIFDIMRMNTPWKWKPAHERNDLTIRLEVVRSALNRMIDGYPGFQLSSKCLTLRKGFNGAYHYRLIAGGDGSRVHEKPDKNMFSHPHDALQYLLLGGGEADIVLNKVRRTERANARRRREPNVYSPFGGDNYRPKGW